MALASEKRDDFVLLAELDRGGHVAIDEIINIPVAGVVAAVDEQVR